MAKTFEEMAEGLNKAAFSDLMNLQRRIGMKATQI